ncbi:MAG: fibrobacter succinogenes major paralogous domain-containing protein [Alistipes sp.]|nr:fibrobacter succinogenes major paralogous domain-containing protein [Alistipes sp.]
MKNLWIPLLALALFGTGCDKEETPQPDQQEQEQPQPPTPGGGEEEKPTPDLSPKEGTMTDPRNGETYATVQLGAQCWMAENLRYLPEGEEQDFEISMTEPRYYVIFDNDLNSDLGAGSLKAYGMFYNLPAATQGEKLLTAEEERIVRGICPEGWHLPSQAEWNALAQYVLDAGMAATLSDGTVDPTAIAKALASNDMWIMPMDTEIEPQPTWVAFDLTTNNASKFNGKPVGFRACSVGEGEDVWMHACYSAGWWSSNTAVAMVDMGVEFGIPVRMWSDLQTFVTTSEFNPGVALPVRCLKN